MSVILLRSLEDLVAAETVSRCGAVLLQLLHTNQPSSLREILYVMSM